jgi:uncharacterized membrane protein YciS (DUF1049 family)
VGALWLGWAFRAGNSAIIDLDLIWMQVAGVELWRVILVALALGGAIAAVLVGFGWLRARLLNRRYRKTIRRLESELHQLRSLPLSGSEEVVAETVGAGAAEGA